MSSEWKTVALGRLIAPDRRISYGIVQPGQPVRDGVPIIRVGDVRDGRINTSDPLRVAPEIEAPYSRTRLNGGELLLTLVGTVGEAAVVPESLAGWNTARAIAVIPVREEIGPYWIYLALRAPAVRKIIESRLNTTVQATLNLRDLAQLPILLPPKNDRSAIERILGALDDKIEVNRRLALSLDEILAQTFFDANFAEANGCEIATVGSRLRCVLGGTPARGRPEYWEAGTIPWINSGAANEFRVTRPSELITQRGLDESATKLLPAGTTIVAITGATMGKVSRIEIETCANQSVVGVLGTTSLPDEFVYFWMRSQVNQLLTRQTGAAQQHVNKGDIESLPLIVPPVESLEQFLTLARPGMRFIASCLAEAEHLTLVRNTLLPRLLSGQVRVRASSDPDDVLGTVAEEAGAAV